MNDGAPAPTPSLGGGVVPSGTVPPPLPDAIPSVPWEGTPRSHDVPTPLASYAAFTAAVSCRLAQGAQEYGDRSFSRNLDDLLGEIEEELLDVAGWGFILWHRLRSVRAQLEGKLIEGGAR